MKTKYRVLTAILLVAFAAAPLAYSTTAAAEQVAATPAKANYLNGTVKFAKDGSHTIVEAK